MAREKMPAAIARGLPISVGDVLKARQRPHLSERFRRIHRRQHGPEVWVFGRRQQPMPGLRPSLGQSLRQAKPPFRREALRQRCPIPLPRCKHRPNPYKPLGAQPIQRKRAACAALSRFLDRFDAEASP